MNRALKPTQDKNISPMKLPEGSASKENSSTKRMIQCGVYSPKRVPTISGMKENMAPGCIGSDPSEYNKNKKSDGCTPQHTTSKRLELKTIDIPGEPLDGTNQTSLNPRVALLEEETTTLLTKLQLSYRLSHDILKEIQQEKAELFDLSPLRSVSKQTEESKKYEEVSAYCQEKQSMSNSYDGVEVDIYEDVSSYCAEKAVLLTSMTELETIKREKDDLLMENSELRHQIEFKSSCYIQARASIASLKRLLKEKERAIRECDEFLKMNDDANTNIVGALTQQHNDQISSLNEKLQKSNDDVRDLESKLEAMEMNWFKIKDINKVKDRQIESAVEMYAALQKIEKENTELQTIIKSQSFQINSLSISNNEFIEVIASLTAMSNEKDQAIDDWANLYRMNDEANKKLLRHAAMKHAEELQENSRRVTGLLNIIKRQKFGENEYVQLQLKEKATLQMEIEAMTRRLDSCELDDQTFLDVHLIIAVVSLSSGLLLLFWSYLVSGLTNC